MSPRGPNIHHITEDYVLETGFLAVESSLKTIEKHSSDPDAFELLWNYTLQKNLLKIDQFAQAAAEDILKDRLHDNVEIRGEESSLADVTFQAHVAALLDMIDGTDLLERGLGNWCSAIVFFNRERVWASLIGMPNCEVYFEQYSDSSAYVREPRKPGTEPRIQAVTVAKPDMRLRDASVAFYGQKPKNFLASAHHRGLLMALDRLNQEAQEKKNQPDAPKFRIYNLAGNPMMMKLVEGKIDAIIELSGQRCHDVIPGFAIALKAGACLIDLDTFCKLSISDLPAILAKPSRKFKYVLACNEPLANEVLNILEQRPFS
jgi:fructose-1,6-bisphosphatase/inositol monophosphatase family enzyme